MEPNPRQHFTTCEHCHREIRADFFAIHSARCLPADMAATRARKTKNEKKMEEKPEQQTKEQERREEDTFPCYLCDEHHPISQLEDHYKICQNRQVECQRCGQYYGRRAMMEHLDQCNGESQPPAWSDQPADVDIISESSLTSSSISRPGTEYSILPAELIPELLGEGQNPVMALARMREFLQNMVLQSMVEGNFFALHRRVMYLQFVDHLIRRQAIRQNLFRRSDGLSEAQFNAIPNKRYIFDGRNTDDCAICCNELAHGIQIKSLECKHLFHSECLKPWLLSNKTCPLCKRIITSPLQENREERRDRQDSDSQHSQFSSNIIVLSYHYDLG